uniref:Reverse transcriptase domain-containing protein n=1 Tax=Oreochromis niloticus TaxID=8128 RepID=A0A669BHJ9_ORENI
MFHVAANDIDEYTDSVCGFIRKCVEDVVPSRTVKSFPNQKPWINGDVRTALAARSTAFASANTSDYKHAHYQLRKTIKAAKREYRDRVEQQFDNPRSMWQGLNAITDFRGKTSTPQTTASLCEDLNVFYARFDTANTMRPDSVRTADDASAHTVSEEDVRKCFRRVNPRKATGPDGIPGRVLKSCAAQLAGVFTHIFNLSLSLSVVPACFKMATIVPVPKSSTISSLNDWRPVALTPIVSKCFEKLVRDFICSALPDSLDPLQFAYRHNRSTDDAIALTLHAALSHLEKRDTYVRMLFVDYSSAFNTIVPSKLDRKLQDLGLSSSLCSWILNFLSDRRQVVRLGSTTSSPITLNTGAPQGCVLSPLLYSLYTYDCTVTNNSNIIVKFADDTTVVGLITNGDETAYREEVSALTHWCQDNHLTLNVAKTKELIVDFRRCRGVHTPITINGAAVERVSSFRFLGVHLAEDLTWSVHINKTVKKAQQRLFFLRRLKRFGMSPRILRTFYRCAIESILTGCITTWYGNSTAYNRKALQRVVRCAERIIGGELPSLQDIYRKRCLRKAGRIIKDSSHPSHKLFRLLPSGRRFCSIRSRTSRLRDSFFHQAIRLLNTS